MREPGRSEAEQSRLAIRVAVFAGLAIVLFAVGILRLWQLEILNGDEYLQQANDNRIAEIRVQPPRGKVVDRNGKVLVSNRTRNELRVTPVELPSPGPELKAELRSLSQLTGISYRDLKKRLKPENADVPGGAVILSQDLGLEKVFYLRENRDRFPGVDVERVFVRDYPRGYLAAHLFGNVGEVTAEQLELPRYRGLRQGDLVGQSGVEYEYDRFLRGASGATRIQVDSLGNTRGTLADKPATAGQNVRLTIDSDLQATGEAALGSFGLPGAFVAMDPRTGEILAMGSTPTFDPAIFTRPITESQYQQLTAKRNDAPLANRAIQGLYPPASTFKLITATAALEEGLITPQTVVEDTGEVTVDTISFKTAGDKVYGPIDMVDALRVSSDVYFYKLGLEARSSGDGGQIQDWAKLYGLGETTGIDLPAETEGLVPNPKWRNQLFSEELTDRPWTDGDNVNLSVGQGDMQTNPLQMAVAYSALANGGTVVTPHLAQSIETVTGETIEEILPAAKRQIEFSPGTRETLLDGFEQAMQKPTGTAYQVFGNWKIPVAGKTGTAERGTDVPDQSWFAAMAPAGNPEIVVVATIERGGFGADAAAPVVARILEAYFEIPQVPPAVGRSGAVSD
ncbi:MAG: penicillin-binding protein 2 [bacterium]